jgi:hypothetical protein
MFFSLAQKFYFLTKFSSQIILNSQKAKSAVHEAILDLFEWSQHRYKNDVNDHAMTKEEAEKHEEQIFQQIDSSIQKAQKIIQETISNLGERYFGSQIEIETTPRTKPQAPLSTEDFEIPSYDSFYVHVGKRNTSFGLFFDGDRYEIDDVLDAGDEDFFTSENPKMEQDYFLLVNELRHPGKSKIEDEKIITLYTARPTKDREKYENSKIVPSNIFLTTSFSEAEGYGIDFGGRDLWRIRIKKKYLILSLNFGTVKNYQTFGKEKFVPVEEIEFLGSIS